MLQKLGHINPKGFSPHCGTVAFFLTQDLYIRKWTMMVIISSYSCFTVLQLNCVMSMLVLHLWICWFCTAIKSLKFLWITAKIISEYAYLCRGFLFQAAMVNSFCKQCPQTYIHDKNIRLSSHIDQHRIHEVTECRIDFIALTNDIVAPYALFSRGPM